MKSQRESDGRSDSCELFSAEFDPDDFQDDETTKECKKYLGYVEGEDSDLMWVVQQAMDSPLPENWRMYETKSGKRCFFNVKTKQYQYLRPFAKEFIKKFQKERSKGIDATVIPLSDSLSISSVHKPCDSASESFDKELDKEQKNSTSLHGNAKLADEIKKQNMENNNILEQLHNQRIEMESLKIKNKRKMEEMKRQHRIKKAQLKLEQKIEIDQLINQIKSIKGEQLRKYADDRDRYRAAVQKFVEDFDLAERFQVESLESNLHEAQENYESQLARMRSVYDKEIDILKNKIMLIQQRGQLEIEKLTRELERRKSQEIERFEKDILGEKREILKQRLKEKRVELKICNAKIFSIKAGYPIAKLKISSPFGLNIVDDRELKLTENVEVFRKCDRDEMTMTEIPPFGLSKRKQVRFYDHDNVNSTFERRSSMKLQSAIDRMDDAFQEVGTSYRNLKTVVKDQSQSPYDEDFVVEEPGPRMVKVFEYPRTFWTPQPVKRREFHYLEENPRTPNRLHSAGKLELLSSDSYSDY